MSTEPSSSSSSSSSPTSASPSTSSRKDKKRLIDGLESVSKRTKEEHRPYWDPFHSREVTQILRDMAAKKRHLDYHTQVSRLDTLLRMANRYWSDLDFWIGEGVLELIGNVLKTFPYNPLVLGPGIRILLRLMENMDPEDVYMYERTSSYWPPIEALGAREICARVLQEYGPSTEIGWDCNLLLRSLDYWANPDQDLAPHLEDLDIC